MKKLVRFETVAEIETDCDDESLMDTFLFVMAKELGKAVASDAPDGEVVLWDAGAIPGYVDEEAVDPLPTYTLKVDVASSEVKVLAEGVV